MAEIQERHRNLAAAKIRGSSTFSRQDAIAMRERVERERELYAQGLADGEARARGYEVGDKVWVRGKHAKTFTIRGTVETLPEWVEPDQLHGVRLENGNHAWVPPERMKPQ